MIGEIKKLIMSGEFMAARAKAGTTDEQVLKSILFEIGYDEGDISAYGFVCYLITQNEQAKYHNLAILLLNGAYSYVPGAYATAFYHAMRVCAIEPGNVDAKEQLLLFHEIPEKLLSDEEARVVATEILRVRPESRAAQLVLEGMNAVKKWMKESKEQEN